MTIPAALLFGLYMYRIRPGRVVEGSLIGVALILAAVLLGPWVVHSGAAGWFTLSPKTLSIILPLYAFIAATLPVWLLLCPRDYLSTYMKIGTIALLVVGVAIVHPKIQMPAVTSFIDGSGPVLPGMKVFPFCFIVIACGAISGFHALIGSGTTPRMIPDEPSIRFIGYGAMLTEGLVAIMALVAATTLVPADYFLSNGVPKAVHALGLRRAGRVLSIPGRRRSRLGAARLHHERLECRPGRRARLRELGLPGRDRHRGDDLAPLRRREPAPGCHRARGRHDVPAPPAAAGLRAHDVPPALLPHGHDDDGWGVEHVPVPLARVHRGQGSGRELSRRDPEHRSAASRGDRPPGFGPPLGAHPRGAAEGRDGDRLGAARFADDAGARAAGRLAARRAPGGAPAERRNGPSGRPGPWGSRCCGSSGTTCRRSPRLEPKGRRRHTPHLRCYSR